MDRTPNNRLPEQRFAGSSDGDDAANNWVGQQDTHVITSNTGVDTDTANVQAPTADAAAQPPPAGHNMNDLPGSLSPSSSVFSNLLGHAMAYTLPTGSSSALLSAAFASAQQQQQQQQLPPQPSLDATSQLTRMYQEALLQSAWQQVQAVVHLQQQQQQNANASSASSSLPATAFSPFLGQSPAAAAAAATAVTQASPFMRTAPPQIVVVDPRENDVLFGRGQPLRDHPGNRRMRSCLHDYRERYLQAPDRETKTQLTRELMTELKQGGARFLRALDGGWTVVPDPETRRKLSHAMRDSIRNLAKQQPSAEDDDSGGGGKQKRGKGCRQADDDNGLTS